MQNIPKVTYSKKYFRRPSQKLISLLMIFSIMIGMSLSPLAITNATNNSLTANEASTIPIIDGILSSGEWDDAKRYDFYFIPISPHPADDITILLKHNTTHLFIAYDVQPDNTSDIDDMGYLWLDLDNNGTKDIEIGRIRNRILVPGFHYVDHYHEGSIENLTAELVCIVAFGFKTTAQEPTRNHTIIEWCIAINTSLTYTGQSLIGTPCLPFQAPSVGVVFGGYGTLTPEWIFGNTTSIKPSDIWGEFKLNATFYGDLSLAFGTGSNPSPDPILIVLILLVPIIGVVLGLFIYLRKRDIIWHS